ncbi:hypothetical protein AVEN_194633-1 [Araneus ventricosus]|uniref:Uncharacterized protein n=1 Tax=Araneus ventricosus TaxID=182803 RepID=A0A4Y2A961_ARAVE|nr:hypothetical protein AVEN_194633-1 [Araneus ventricosus]
MLLLQHMELQFMQCPSSESKSTYLLCSKSRYSQLKPVTIPRSTLCSTVAITTDTESDKGLNLTISAVPRIPITTVSLMKPPQELKHLLCHRVTAPRTNSRFSLACAVGGEPGGFYL